MLAAIKSFFGEIFGGGHDDGGAGGGGRIGGFGDISGFGAEHGFGERWGAAELGGNAPREARIAEAAYEARLQNTRDSLAAQRALQNGETRTATAILERNPNVGVAANGVEFYGRAGAQVVEAQARQQQQQQQQQSRAAQAVAALSGVDRASQLKATLNSQLPASTPTSTASTTTSTSSSSGRTNGVQSNSVAAPGLPPVPPGMKVDAGAASRQGVRLIVDTSGINPQGTDLGRAIARQTLMQYGMSAEEAARFLRENPADTYRTQAGRGTAVGDADLRARVASGSVDSTLTAEYVQKLEAFRQRVAADDEVLSMTTSVARHTEGLRSAVEGAFYGGFSDNDTWSAVAGQTAVGFIPIVGQIADARDIAAAAKDVYDGKDGSWAGLGIAAVAVIPGLDFLKGGSKVGRKVLSQVVEEGLSDVAKAGLKHAAKELSAEGAQRAAKELVTLKVARTEVTARLDDLLTNGNLQQNTQGVVKKALNGLRDHATEDDLIGALRDKVGRPVRESGSGYTFDHLGEVNRDVLTPLGAARDSLIKELDRYSKGSTEYKQLSQEIDALSETRRRILDFLEIK